MTLMTIVLAAARRPRRKRERSRPFFEPPLARLVRGEVGEVGVDHLVRIEAEVARVGADESAA